MLYLYDPKINVLTETNYEYLEGLTGQKKQNLMSYKSRGQKLAKIGCYLVDEKVTLKQRKEWYMKEKYHDEHWKVIEGSDDKFLVSNYGRFKKIYKKKEGFLLPFIKKKGGYMEAKVRFLGKYGNHKVADIVAHHFVRPKKVGERLLHKNLIKTDNFAGNLEYVSMQELGRRTGQLAKSKPVVLLDPDTLEVLGEFRSAREAGRQNFISYQSVMDNCNKKTKKSGGMFLFMWSEEYEQLLA